MEIIKFLSYLMKINFHDKSENKFSSFTSEALKN